MQLVESLTLQLYVAWQSSLCCYAALHLLQQTELLLQLTKVEAKHRETPSSISSEMGLAPLFIVSQE